MSVDSTTSRMQSNADKWPTNVACWFPSLPTNQYKHDPSARPLQLVQVFALPPDDLINPHPHNHPLCNSLPPFQVLISPCRQCLGKQPPGFNRPFSDVFDRLACDALQPAMKKGHIKIANIKTQPIFIHSGQPTSSQSASILTTTTNRVDLDRPPSLPSHHPLGRIQHSNSSRRLPYQRKQPQTSPRPCNRKSPSCINNLQLFNANCRISKEVSVIQLHITPPATVSRANWMTMTSIVGRSEEDRGHAIWY